MRGAHAGNRLQGQCSRVYLDLAILPFGLQPFERLIPSNASASGVYTPEKSAQNFNFVLAQVHAALVRSVVDSGR